MNPFILDQQKYAALARQTSAEGIVLLRNERDTLPIKKGQTISLFGRIQFDYYKSGTGSGGMVNTRYVVSILDALRSSEHFHLNKELLEIYEEWINDNPFDNGIGWGGEPWSQKEMPMTDEIAENAAKKSDGAVIIIGRTAGEDQDNSNAKGSYLLTDAEELLLETVCKYFDHVTVVLNVGNIIDMKWVEKYNPSAVLYSWQGGQEGGNAVCDVLTGAVNPSGKLADTIAYDITDYPSTADFGDDTINYYKEDIYVGYRYFETAGKEKVLYPFGFGLSYTSFDIWTEEYRLITEAEANSVSFRVSIKNNGNISGKEVVQIYISQPQGSLGKPSRALVAFDKTKELKPGETESIDFQIPVSEFASYDDSGITGHKSCYVLEDGTYKIYAGNNVRAAAFAGEFEVPKLLVVEQLKEALSPVRSFGRLKPEINDSCIMKTEEVPTRSYDLINRISQNLPEFQKYTGDKGYKLEDIIDGKISVYDFVSQLSDDELCCLVRGEGMCSPKVTPGTAAAFGGVTDALLDYGIPIGCCADGPSGLRMDCGALAFSLPNGTAIGCTFNKELTRELFEMTGLEMRRNRIDLILGPGLNIHRNPLNGRNFEYFSEDPYLTGKMAAAQLKGLHKWKVSGTIKHFAGNNQEFARTNIDSVVSERAIREIYLKGFEIAVKEGNAFSVMSTYGALNGIWTAGGYDLLTTILRDEWGFSGIVMTDWWAKINNEGEEAVNTNLSAMVRGQNDLYMVVKDSLTHKDNLAEGLKSGAVTRGELLRCAANICGAIVKLPTMERYLGNISKEELDADEKAEAEDGALLDLDYITLGKELPGIFDVKKIDTSARASTVFGLVVKDDGEYALSASYRINAGEMAQIPLTIFINNNPAATHVFNGTNNNWSNIQIDLPISSQYSRFVKLYFAQSGVEFGELSLKLK